MQSPDQCVGGGVRGGAQVCNLQRMAHDRFRRAVRGRGGLRSAARHLGSEQRPCAGAAICVPASPMLTIYITAVEKQKKNSKARVLDS